MSLYWRSYESLIFAYFFKGFIGEVLALKNTAKNYWGFYYYRISKNTRCYCQIKNREEQWCLKFENILASSLLILKDKHQNIMGITTVIFKKTYLLNKLVFLRFLFSISIIPQCTLHAGPIFMLFSNRKQYQNIAKIRWPW